VNIEINRNWEGRSSRILPGQSILEGTNERGEKRPEEDPRAMEKKALRGVKLSEKKRQLMVEVNRKIGLHDLREDGLK